MLTLDEVKAQLADRTVSKVARATGISRSTIDRMLKGYEPSYGTVKILSDYLGGKSTAA